MRVLGILAAASLLLAGCVASETNGGPGGTPAGTTDCLARVHGLDLQQVTLAELQDALTKGRITSVQLVEAYIERIAAYDDIDGPGVGLNSVREVSPTALAQAKALDDERAAGKVRGPLHGIPILLKDNIGTFDEPTTAGSIALAGNIPRNGDATLTQNLRDAGMVILGKTNLSEFANWVDLSMPNGYSSLGGQVVNAYTGGDPSGSSSGSGVAGSMALASITVGTETSGSILGPSDANSLVGVKPTVGLVSRAGVIPLAANFDTPGPMGRNVEDVALVLGAMSGRDPLDAATTAAPPQLPNASYYTSQLRPDGLQGVRLGYDLNDDGEVFLQALDDLRAAGADLVSIDRDQLDFVSVTELAFIFNEFKSGINDYLANQAGPGLPVTDLTGIILYNNDHPDQVKYGQSLLIASDAQPGDFVTAQFAATPTILSSRAVADRFFAEVDAIVGPSLAYVSIGAAAGYPTVIVPAGYTGTNGNNPEGLSFFGPAWSEPDLLRYAYAYEQATHHRRTPAEVAGGIGLFEQDGSDVVRTLLDGVCDLHGKSVGQGNLARRE